MPTVGNRTRIIAVLGRKDLNVVLTASATINSVKENCICVLLQSSWVYKNTECIREICIPEISCHDFKRYREMVLALVLAEFLAQHGRQLGHLKILNTNLINIKSI